MTDADQKITRGTTALFLENSYARTSGAVSLFYSWGDHWINDGYYYDPDPTKTDYPKEFRFISFDEMAGASA